MQKRIIDVVFVCAFALMVLLPVFRTNLKDNVISEAENRYLVAKPKLYYDDGKLNKEYLSDLEAWINDNIGFRSNMVISNAKIQ